MPGKSVHQSQHLCEHSVLATSVMHRSFLALQLAAIALPALSLAPPPASTWELDRSLRLLSKVKLKTSRRPLDLLEDLYDRESGLTGEGVWHNAHFGAAHLLAARCVGSGPLGKAIAAELRSSAKRLGDSLFDLNYDQGFRLRTASGIWKQPEAAVESGGERPSFYEPSRDRRCVSNAAAVIFYSLLSEDTDDDRIGEIGEKFLDLFFDEKLGRFRRGAVGDSGEYWRSVDQAMAILACRRLGGDRAAAAAAAAATALREDFGYGTGRPVNHLGPFPGTRRRNSWHDAFAVYALALDGDNLVDMMRADYESADNGLLAHQARDAGTSPYLGDGSAVHFACTQAVWSAVSRAMGGAGFEAHDAAWRRFDAATSRDGLFVVADAYPNVRLWCNTEPAFWLLVEPDIFASNSLS